MSKTRVILLGVTFLACVRTYGQLLSTPIPGEGAAMGDTWISLNSPFYGLLNPAALGYTRTYWAGGHHEYRFLLNELGSSLLGATIPVKPGTFGVLFSRFGYSQYSKIRTCIGYGMHLGKRIVAGVGFSFARLQSLGDYRNENAYLLEGGIHYLPNKKLTFGFYIFNPTHSQFYHSADIPVLMGVGLTYSLTERIILVFQIDDDTERKPAVRCGMQYFILNGTAFRLGYSSTSPEGITVGLGLPIESFQVDFGLSHNLILGFTPKLSISYKF